MMKKKILSIILAALMIVSTCGLYTGAAPSVAEDADTVAEYAPEFVYEAEQESAPEDETVNTEFQDDNKGPGLVLAEDSAFELNTEFGSPQVSQTAFLMAELSGDGTEESPYLIGTAEDLKLMSSNINSGKGYSAHYKLTADIDLNGAEWTPIGYYSELYKDTVAFCGVFDGNGHTISNFKITKDDVVYVGLFGRVVGGTIRNLNVDSARINVKSSRSQRIYVGALAGRVTTTSPATHAVIEYCNVTNSSITYLSYGTIYVGGLAGSVISGPYNDTSIFVGFSSAECDINASTVAKNSDDKQPHVVAAGGIVGFLRAEVGSTVTVINSGANANVYAHTLSTVVAQPLCGGAFGNVRTVDTSGSGTIRISSCYSEGTVLAESDFYNYIAGGFAAQFYATKSLTVTDCYSSSTVTGRFVQAGAGCGADPTAGGFVGQIYFSRYSASYGKTIKNCYASGNVTELTHTDTTPKDYSFVGGFTGYSTSPVLENCYRLDTQTVVGSDILEVDYQGLTLLSQEDSINPEKYVGFDMESVWKMDTEADYPYPTLRSKTTYVNFISEAVSFATSTLTSDGKAVKPSANPSKASTIDKVFVFSHWSAEKGGEPFDFENTIITENTTLYAVFSSLVRNYTVSFVSDGKTLSSSKLGFGSPVTAPEEIPEKAASKTHYYNFLYWSDAADGDKYDFNDCTVTGNMTFYAVFEAIDKTAWEGDVAESFASGFGTQAMPYIISTGEEFALFAKVINEQQDGYVNAHYALSSNIHLGGKTWVPIGISEEAPFSGSFDGNGYSVSNFRLSENQYTGLFGYILNGTVKNLAINNFTIALTPTTDLGFEKMYVGPVAGYVSAKNGESTISAVSVTEGTTSIDGSVDRLYAGGIIGYGHSVSMGRTNILDSYALNDITALNATGYNYLGGIAGELHTGSGGLSQIVHCYTKGVLDSECMHSSRAGGLVGYLYSSGSAYTSEETDGDASLLEDDVDIMIKDSFAITSAYSLSTHYTSYAGRITAERNTHGGVENVFVPRSAGVVIRAEMVSSTMATREDSTGASTELSNLKSVKYLSESRGFDFENTWIFISDFEYPVLRCTVTDKPMLAMIEKSFVAGKLDFTIQVMSNTDSYTIMIGIYNSRNQLIKFERKNFTKTDSSKLITLSYDNMDSAEYISVSACESTTLTPLFNPIKASI